MEQLKVVKDKINKNPIPVFGIESKDLKNDEDKASQIALSAYYKAEARGYEPGHELQDWLEAEAEINQHIEAD